jgi:hypothetical protein
MNRYLMIRRLWWPVMLVLTGVLALLNELDVARFSHTWPLYLIFWGALLLAERAAIHEADMPPYVDPMGSPYAGPVGGVAPVRTVTTSIVPAHGDEIAHRDKNDGGAL